MKARVMSILLTIGSPAFCGVHFAALSRCSGFPGGSAGKESDCSAGDPSFDSWVRKIPWRRVGYPLQHSWASLVAQMVNNLLAMRETRFIPWVGKIPWRRAWRPTPVFLPWRIPRDRRFVCRLVGYSPRGHKELDTTEQLRTAK